MAMGTAVFDVCDTLYRENTTVGFLRFLGQRGHIGVAKTVSRWTNRGHLLFWVGAACHRLFGIDVARARMIGSLAGLNEREIHQAAQQYVDQGLAAKRNEQIFDRLDAHQTDGNTIWLASNSLDPVVAAIARSIGANHVASRIGYQDGICTGRLETDLTGRKSFALSKELADAQGPMHVYTDNPSDRDLIEMADHAVVVIPKGRARVQWAGEADEYVYL